MKIIDRVVNLIKADVENKDVLEAACGSADLSVALSFTAKSVKCIDLVGFRLNPLLLNCPNVEFIIMDAAKMTFADNSFDTVVIYNAAYHIKDEFDKILSECMRVAKSGGAIRLISSFSIDKSVIENAVIPILQRLNAVFTVERAKEFISVTVSV